MNELQHLDFNLDGRYFFHGESMVIFVIFVPPAG